jgi:hypothetical protein
MALFGPPGAFSVCFRSFPGLYGLDPGQGFLGGLLGQKDGVGLGQLDASDLDYGLALLVIPASFDLDAREEGLVVAAPGALVGQLVDAGDVLGQLQDAAEVALVPRFRRAMLRRRRSLAASGRARRGTRRVRCPRPLRFRMLSCSKLVMPLLTN